MHQFVKHRAPCLWFLFIIINFISLTSLTHFAKGYQDVDSTYHNSKVNDAYDDEDDFEENVEYKYVTSSTHHIQNLFNSEKELVYRL